VQIPTGQQWQTHPIPRPRPDGSADLGILADDVNQAPAVGSRSLPPLPEPGPGRNGITLAGEAIPFAHDEPEPEPAPKPEPTGPIFVDASGRRRKLARRASLAAVAVLAGYVGMLAVSFAGGPIPPNALLPVPGIPSGKPQLPASSAPAGTASASASAKSSTAAGRPAAGASDHRTGARSTTPGGAPGQSVSSGPASTMSASSASSPVPPTPTGTSVATTPTAGHGNPSAPGRTRRTDKSPSPTSTT
jgi:hypothetical protein